ncbi:MAG: ATP-dependent zinc metalloprotease FtsH [Tepidisphaeraceae bacterium]
MSEPNRPERQPRQSPGNGRPGAPGGSPRFGRNILAWMLLVGLAIALFLLLQYNRKGGQRVISLSEFMNEVRDKNVKLVTIAGSEITGTFDKPKDAFNRATEFYTEIPTAAQSWEFTRDLLNSNSLTQVKVENHNDLWVNLLVPLLPWILIIAFFWFFVFRQLRNAGGGAGMLGNFGRSRHKITSKEHTNVTFEDVAGVDEAKDEVREIVEFLKNPKRFQRLGGRIPRGVLLMGEPGTGKTLLAKAIAGEADVPFFSISGSDFVEMFVGVGASRVRDLFKQAKDNSPCIIFLDEIDAVGRRRGAGFSSGGHDEREQTLNAILVEMDGFDTNDQVIVVAATNRLDVLDPALTRPGRFDRTVTVQLPDVKGRLEILKVHARKVKLGPNVDLARLARATPGFSGADLAAIINEAALGATLANKDFIEQQDLEEARDKVRFGRARKSRVIDEKEKLATAYHEAGHAVIQYLEEDADPIHKVTIIPRGAMGGATMTLPEKDRMSTSKKWCLAFLKMGMGGRIAEEMFTGDINTGAFGDIRQVTSLARRMIREWGMNEKVGFVYYGEDDQRMSGFDFGGGKEYSDETARLIDSEVKKLIDWAEAEARRMLQENRERVEAIARALMKYETLDGTEIDRIMKGESLTKPSVTDLLDPPPQQPRRPIIQSNDGTPDIPPGAIPAT